MTDGCLFCRIVARESPADIVYEDDAVLAFKEGGGAKLRRQAIRDSLLLAGAMSLFCIVILFAGEAAMRFLFRDLKYDGQGHVTTVLAVALLALAVGSPASNALASMKRPRPIVWTTLIAAGVTLPLVWFSAREWGLLGAAYGVLVGNAVGAIARWITFLAVVSQGDTVRN